MNYISTKIEKKCEELENTILGKILLSHTVLAFFYGVFLFWMFVVFLSVFASVPAGARPALLLEGFQCCGVVGLAGDFVDEVAVDDAAVFVEDEDASGEESCEGSVNEL